MLKRQQSTISGIVFSEHVPHVSLEVVSQRADVHAPVVFDF